MKKKLLHFVAICLALVMTATVLPNVTTKLAYATESGETGGYPVAFADTDEDDYSDLDDLPYGVEEDLRFVEYLTDFFTNVTLECSNKDFDESIFVKFYGTSNNAENEEFYVMFDEQSMMFEYSESEFSMDKMYSRVTISEDGSLDTVIESDYGCYNVSDYKDDTAFGDLLEACNNDCQTFNDGVAPASLNGFFSSLRAVLFVVVVYVIVSEIAEQIKAESNYRHNNSLKGPDNYIDNQNEYADFRYGFASFDQVGCGVVAAYNAMLAIGKPEELAQVIYEFEKWGIEYSVGWGHLGSNPRHIYRYLSRHDVRYKKINSLYTLDRYAKIPTSEHFILGRWNKPITDGAHIFYIHKIDSDAFIAYNNNQDKDTAESIYDFGEGYVYMSGYVVFED